MTVPVWVLLGFAAWTINHLLATVGLYRWSRILTGRTQMKEFRADKIEGEDWYLRTMRAQANCVENRPVYGSVVVAIEVLAFIVEEHDNGDYTVFVPTAPTPTIGTIYFLKREKVRKLDVPMAAGVDCIMQWGVGSKSLLAKAS